MSKKKLIKNNVKLLKSGDKFGFLTIINDKYESIGEKTKRIYFNTMCDCGVELKVSGTDLRTERKQSCKNCSFKKRSLNSKSVSQIDQVFRRLVEDRCKSNNIELKINVKDYEEITKLNCYYCGDKPRETNRFKSRKYINNQLMYINGIDRLDSDVGYILENCVPCCTSCNYAKHRLSKLDFFKKIIKIYKNLNLENYNPKD